MATIPLLLSAAAPKGTVQNKTKQNKTKRTTSTISKTIIKEISGVFPLLLETCHYHLEVSCHLHRLESFPPPLLLQHKNEAQH
jgi:hypothetical protein